MYVSPNYKTKADLKRGLAQGDLVTIFQPGPFGGNEPTDGRGIPVEGPHFPEPHRWYGQVDVEAGLVVRVK